MHKRVLFLCTGNYYRSRFAEHFFNHLYASHGWEADSRGFRIDDGRINVGPISANAMAGLRHRGIAVETPRYPLALVEEDLRAASRIIALDGAEHRPFVAAQFPHWQDRVEYWDVRDVPPSAAYDPPAEIANRVRALGSELGLEDGRSVDGPR